MIVVCRRLLNSRHSSVVLDIDNWSLRVVIVVVVQSTKQSQGINATFMTYFNTTICINCLSFEKKPRINQKNIQLFNVDTKVIYFYGNFYC